MIAPLAIVDRSSATAGFAEAMSAVASGVVLVTCRVDGRPWGMTVTAFASVSVDPPTVLVSLGSESVAARAVAAAGRFGVSVLDEAHVDVARFASAPGAPKFLEPFADSLSHALAELDCEVAEAAEVADHTIFFGRVLHARAARSGPPLLYHRRDYCSVAPLERSIRCLAN